jgi:hypothetical protein
VTYVTNWLPTNITTAIVHNVEINGNLAVIAHYTAGIRIVNITNPAVPTEVAWYDTYPSSNSSSFSGCWGVFMFPSGKIIGSDMSGGLFVIKIINPPTGINNNGNIPNTFSLEQNYPNPFNPSTTVKFNLPKSAHVTIKVFDALGRQVALLADEFRQAGSYRINFDAANLASGVYYYSMIADGFKQTKKMTLIK